MEKNYLFLAQNCIISYPFLKLKDTKTNFQLKIFTNLKVKMASPFVMGYPVVILRHYYFLGIDIHTHDNTQEYYTHYSRLTRNNERK